MCYWWIKDIQGYGPNINFNLLSGNTGLPLYILPEVEISGVESLKHKVFHSWRRFDFAYVYMQILSLVKYMDRLGIRDSDANLEMISPS